MNRRLLLAGGAIALVALMFAFSQTRTVPVAEAVGPQPASVSWDEILCDGPNAPNDPQCAPVAGPPVTAVGNGDSIIDEGENPELQTNLWIDLTWNNTSDEEYFDLANSYWTTGPAGPDRTNDGWEDPLSGLAASKVSTLGAAVGAISFKITSNMGPLATLLQNNVDDIIGSMDPTVMGQPPTCDSNPANPRVLLADTFEMWSSTTALTPTVSYRDTDAPGNPGYGCAESQEDYLIGAPNNQPCALTNAPRGVMANPSPLTNIIARSGLPASQYMTRGFGIARLVIATTPVLLTNDVDVNFLVFNLVQAQQRYVNITVVQYPGEPSTPPVVDPSDDAELAQTVVTCPPYWTAPVRVYGISTAPDFNEDGDTTDPAELLINPVGQVHRVAMNPAGPFDYMLDKSTSEDYDGDGIANVYDRCNYDPSCGLADADGDWLCGLCDSVARGANGEGVGCPTGGVPVRAIPWAVCQDADLDKVINAFDNCPTVANATQEDVDTDNVGDLCDGPGGVATAAGKVTPGDGTGYASGFNDQDNKCNDAFTIGLKEPVAENGAPPPGTVAAPAKYCMGPASDVGLTEQPYINPALWPVGNTPFLDSNDDGEPDYEVVANVGTLYDGSSDSDRDGHSDACEGKNPPADALNKASTPGLPAVAGVPGVGGDCDGGGESDIDEVSKQFPTDPFNAADDQPLDSDGDGCQDWEEGNGVPEPAPGSTGDYNAAAWYDFFDTAVPAKADAVGPNGPRDKAIAMDDVLAILFYVNTYDGDTGDPNPNGVTYDADKGIDYDGDNVADIPPDGVDDGLSYDRSPGDLPNPPWGVNPPDGAVTMDDVLAALAQTGLQCGAGPMQRADVIVSNLVLTVNGTPYTAGSTVDVPSTPSTILDVRLTERVNHVMGKLAPVQVKEYVYFKDAPTGTYHCVNDPAAVTKTGTPPAVKTRQDCTVDGKVVTPSTMVVIPNPALPVVRPILDVLVMWTLTKNTDYVKTVNMIHIGDSPGPYVWTLNSGLVPGVYPIMVCAKEVPEWPAVENNWANNAACTPYTLNVLP